LVLAGVAPREIAGKLRTKSSRIVIYTKLFFDVLRYFETGSGWLHSLVFSPLHQDAAAWEIRERNLMAAALIRGQQGVGNVFSPGVRLTESERDQRLADIQAALAHRASEWLIRLELEGVPPGAADLTALLRVTDVLARQPDRQDASKKMMAFTEGLQTLLCNTEASEEAWENALDNPDLQPIRDVLIERLRGRHRGGANAVGQRVLLTW
jgi:hypothetical protein